MRRALLVLVLAVVAAGCSDDAPAEPEAFVDRSRLPGCGTIVFDGAGVLSSDEEDAERCFRGADVDGFPAELEVVHFTVEGDPIRTYLRSLEGEPGVEVFIDSTESEGGRWRHLRCAGLAAEFIEAVDCRPVTTDR